MCANIMSQISAGKSQESLCARLDFPDNEAGTNGGASIQVTAEFVNNFAQVVRVRFDQLPCLFHA